LDRHLFTRRQGGPHQEGPQWTVPHFNQLPSVRIINLRWTYFNLAFVFLFDFLCVFTIGCKTLVLVPGENIKRHTIWGGRWEWSWSVKTCCLFWLLVSLEQVRSETGVKQGPWVRDGRVEGKPIRVGKSDRKPLWRVPAQKQKQSQKSLGHH
jgi:hypothetical protein